MTTLLLMMTALGAVAQATPRASSQLRNDGGYHTAMQAFDGQLQTAWAEGESGYGEGSWLELDLDRPTEIRSISLWSGNITRGVRSFRENSRPKTISIWVDGQKVESIRLHDELRRWDLTLKAPATGRKVRVVFDEVFEGIVFSDLYITEMAINFPDQGPLGPMAQWLESPEALKMLERHNTDVETAYFAIKDAEFGSDADNFGFLCDAAADGPEYVRGRVRAKAPDGYRVQALPASEKALEALRKLGDANAIPCLEMAALRAWGDVQAVRRDEVERFEAYADLIGGPNYNIPAWGTEGWEAGAFQSFGEPMPIEIDQFVQLFVIDPGNNRLQRFNERGNVDRIWGPAEPTITNAWFEKGRKFYVSGAKPGRKAGMFETPIDIAIIPGKEGDTFATLEASGRVQVYDIEGQPTISWTANARDLPEPLLGGTGYIEWLPKYSALLVILQDEAILYSLNSDEINRWEIADGTPNALEVIKGGKRLLMAFGDEITEYTVVDGFRNRVVIDGEILGRGFESLDMTLDEGGHLWVLTDKGRLIKFKKPGKVEFVVQAFDNPIRYPRLAVFEGIAYVTANNAITRIDALQLLLDEAAEAAKEDGDTP